MVFSAEAEITPAADDHRFYSHPVSKGKFGDRRTHFDDFSGDLVTDGHGERSQGMLPFVEMDISPADAAGLDSEQNVMIPHGREGSFHELHLPGSGDHGHGVVFHK
jgi:hypothetical protein